ncbi:MAG: M81 family metallopeptidase [Rhodovibrionaceae bacterium]
MRIAVGGFQHETNTFAPSKATYADFTTAGAWPGLTRGEKLLPAIAGINIPIAGFCAKGKELDFELVPLSWAQATPSAQVTEDAFERIVAQILEDLEAARNLDGVYLDLHGAMVTEHQQDGEGEILRRVRNVVGELPIVVSLDLHANATPEMFELSDALIAYRTYPHVDMAATGARCAHYLHRLLKQGAVAGRAYRQLPFLIPLTGGCTMVDPAGSLYKRLGELERQGAVSASFNAGFGPADIWHCGPSVQVYAARQGEADSLAEGYVEAVLAREAEFAGGIYPAREAVAYAKEQAAKGRTPIVIADTQDNPGAGGNGDTVGLLRELIEQDAPDAVLGILYDPASAAAAHAAGVGETVDFALGSISGLPGHAPLEGRFEIVALGDGRFTGTGPFYKGARMQLGPMARLRLGGVEVLLTSSKQQAADQEMFRHLGVEPAEREIVALKSSVHFRADFQPIAAEVIVAAAPGPNPVDHRDLDYRNLRPGVRLMPGGPESKGPRA